ncbi:MAG TPA: ABC transporter permease [Acetobacteraceae bacterium]|jgi:ABC-type spermidine/putrescine transport system permease subunit I|nr:ABC transporter permease [Acetobacteraceae bacterium]
MSDAALARSAPLQRTVMPRPPRHFGPALLVAPLVLYMAVFYALPVLAMLARSVIDPHLTLRNFIQLGGDGVFLHVFANTLLTAAIVTLGTLLLGYPVALALSRMRGMAATVTLIIVLLPFWTSVLVRSYAWMVLLGRHGLINEALRAAALIDTPLRLLNTAFAVRIAMIHILLPYMILPIASVLRQLDPALPRAAASLGARPWGVFAQVVLPLSMPGVIAGTLLVFVLSLGFYITPALVGGPRDMMLSQLIAQQVDLLNWPYAACLSATLLAATLALLLLCQALPGVRGVLRPGLR